MGFENFHNLEPKIVNSLMSQLFTSLSFLSCPTLSSQAFCTLQATGSKLSACNRSYEICHFHHENQQMVNKKVHNKCFIILTLL